MGDRTLVSNLKIILKNCNMTQTELHELTGVRIATINALCNNKIERYPKSALEKICNALEMDNLSDLLTIVKEQTESSQDDI